MSLRHDLRVNDKLEKVVQDLWARYCFRVPEHVFLAAATLLSEVEKEDRGFKLVHANEVIKIMYGVPISDWAALLRKRGFSHEPSVQGKDYAFAVDAVLDATIERLRQRFEFESYRQVYHLAVVFLADTAAAEDKGLIPGLIHLQAGVFNRILVDGQYTAGQEAKQVLQTIMK